MRNPRTLHAFAATMLAASTVATASTRMQDAPKHPPDSTAKPDRQRDDLVGRLTRKAVNEGDEDLMDGLMRLMGDVVRKLQNDFDPGEQTMTVQREISAKLDEAIQTAAARRRVRHVSPPARAPDKRKLPAAARPGEPKREPGAVAPSEQGGTDAPPGSAGVEAVRPGGELRDTRRGWGHLPQRDRDEVIQGIEEQSLERYRQWIERYYRSLQEADR